MLHRRGLSLGLGLIAALASAAPALAQKQGGTLRSYIWDNPPSASIHEEATISTVFPFMPVFNNLVVFDQTKLEASLDTIVPDLATSWTWDARQDAAHLQARRGRQVARRQAVHGQGRQVHVRSRLGARQLRGLPQEPAQGLVSQRRGDRRPTATTRSSFQLKAPQPSFLALLASGYSPIYPCHVSQKRHAHQAGRHRARSRSSSSSAARSSRWRAIPTTGRRACPSSTASSTAIIDNRSTRVLAFMAGDVDLTFVSDITVAGLKDINAKAPNAMCQFVPSNNTINMIVNSGAPPFDKLEVRKAMALALDRSGLQHHPGRGQVDDRRGDAAGARRQVGACPTDELAKIPGYGPDLAKNQAEARKIMEGLGYSAAKPLKVKVSTRNIPLYRDPAVIFIDQMKKIHIEGELEVVDTTIWHAKVQRKDYAIGLNTTGVGVDDPDVNLVENYTCKSDRNYTGYCNEEVDKLIFAQSRETDPEKRRQLLWEAERKIADDVARPIILHNRAATCWHPHVKGVTSHNNSLYNSWRMENAWLDK